MTPPSRPKPIQGVYDRPFWRFLDAGELRLQRCTACGHWRFPPGPICPRCRSNASSWEATSGRGRLLAWTVFRRQYFPDLPVPYAVGSVQAAEGPMLIADLVNVPLAEIRHGMAVRAAFERVAGPDGSWTIYQWEPDPRVSIPLNAERERRTPEPRRVT